MKAVVEDNKSIDRGSEFDWSVQFIETVSCNFNELFFILIDESCGNDIEEFSEINGLFCCSLNKFCIDIILQQILS